MRAVRVRRPWHEQSLGETIDVDGPLPRLGGSEIVDGLRDLLRIENRDRRAAIAAGAFVLKVERCPAVGALDGLHLRLQVGELGARHRAHEILLEQKLKERRQMTVTELAPEIGEARRMLQIVRERETRAAARAGEESGERMA